ncbi:MAG: homocysteine S-methyltransferase family protein [Planctomycetota bacterium]|jgi:methionine synthase I (cobalamin-dependent)
MSFDLGSFAKRVRVTDGAWGTQLQTLGLPPGALPEPWNVENPQAVDAVARSYIDAGSEVIITNTFGANRFILAQHGAEGRVGELAEAGAAISRRAAGDAVKVFASIGPSGKIVMMGEVDEDEMVAAFAETAAAVAAGGADAILIESFGELAEAELALRGARSACELPVVVSMTFDSGPDGTSTMMGNTPADLVAAAEAGGATAVGANCGVGPENYVKVVELLAAATSLPVWVKPNAGLPVVVDGETTFPMGAEEFAGFAGPLMEAGASLLGGCCGTSPEHLQALRAAVDAAIGG